MQNGYANAYKNLLSSLSKVNKYDITVLTTTSLESNEELVLNGINIIRLTPPAKIKYYKFYANSKFLAKKITSLDNKNNFDLIFFESGDEPLITTMLDDKILSKTIIRYHSTSDTEYTEFFPGLLNKVNKYIQHNFIAKKVSNFCSTNDYHISFIKNKFLKGNEYLISKKKFFVIPNTMHTDRPNEVTNGIPREKEIFILGRLNPEGYYQKGFSDFIDVLKNLTLEEIKGYKFHILGDGVFYDSLKLEISKLGIKDSITLTKKMPHEEVLRKLSTCRAVILPSRFEGHSMFALEAIASGAVPIFSNAGALKTMNPSPDLMFNSQNSYELKSKILKFISYSDDVIISKSKDSVDFYNENYSQKLIVEKFDFMIRSIGIS